MLLAGPGRGDGAILDPTLNGGQDFQWSPEKSDPADSDPAAGDAIDEGYTGRQNRIGSTAVLLPNRNPAGAHEVLQIGGFDDVLDADGDVAALASAEAVDGTAATPIWRQAGAMTVGRSYQNTQILPDGSLVTIGGGYGEQPGLAGYATGGSTVRRAPEFFDPATPAAGWRRGTPQTHDRTYHSVALMLPDGRLLSTGDDVNNKTEPTGELFTPPQLAAGHARPQITGGADAMRPGAGYTVRTPQAATSRVVLLAPSATTHGADMSQRHVELDVRRRGADTIAVAAPPTTAVAPPGYYMLLLVDPVTGTPSLAKWVHVSPSAPGEALVARDEPPAPTTTPVTPEGKDAKTKTEAASKLKITARFTRGRKGIRVRVTASRRAMVSVRLVRRSKRSPVLSQGKVRVAGRTAFLYLKDTRTGRRQIPKLRRPAKLALRLRAVDGSKRVVTRTVNVVLRG